jgi:hypothetical protein
MRQASFPDVLPNPTKETEPITEAGKQHKKCRTVHGQLPGVPSVKTTPLPRSPRCEDTSEGKDCSTVYNPREQKHRRDRAGEYDDEEDDDVDPRIRTLKLSFDWQKPDQANERFTQREDLQKILFEGIVLASFRDILILEHKAHVTDAGIAVPKKSKMFEECLQKAARAIGLRQDVFVRPSSLFGMTRSEGQS